MKLRRLVIERLPGITPSFALDDLGDGVQIIIGPNGSGKSSLCRAIRALLWGTNTPADYISAHAVFERLDQTLRVERDGARYRWQEHGVDITPPAMPPGHLGSCFFLTLRDLLDPAENVGVDLARQVRLQMSGGFDIDKVSTELFEVGTRYGRHEEKALNQAEQNLSHATGRHNDLFRKQTRLAELEQDLNRAHVAERRLAALTLALEVVKLREANNRIAAELATHPSAYQRMTGNEMAELDKHESELETLHEQLRVSQLNLQSALADAADTRLEEPLDTTPLAASAQRADALAALEAQIDSATNTLAGQRGALVSARQVVGGGDVEASVIGLAGAANLFAFLRDATRVQTDTDAVAQRLRILSGVTFTETDRRRLDLLRAGAGALRAWLRSPEPVASDKVALGKKRQVLYTLAAILIVTGAVLSFATGLIFGGLAFAALAATGLGVGVATWWLTSQTVGASGQEAARRDFPADLSGPAVWSITDVASRLREIEGDVADCEGLARHAGFADADRTTLENRRNDLQHELTALAARRESLAAALGLAVVPADAELVDTARALDALRVACQAEQQSAEQLRELTERYQKGLTALADEVTRHGEAIPHDAAAAREALRTLANRSTNLRQAREREQTAGRETARVGEELKKVTTAIDDLYRRCDLDVGDRAGLVRLLDGFDHYRQLSRDCDQGNTEERFATRQLEAAGELDLASHDTAWLHVEQQKLTEIAGGREQLQAQISDIHAEVSRARDSHDVEDAIAKRDQCRVQLEERRARALESDAGRFLLNQVKHEHEANQMPRVLERARELFARFTGNTYELNVTPAADGSFVAIDARSGKGLRPDQLSDGTRVQLLLAARLAFAHQAEGNMHLPLFLDEALEQSDPVRFRAIARSLGRIAEDEDRQIFYLTSDPGDASRIQFALAEEGCRPANLIDLGAVRSLSASVVDADALHVEFLPIVPSPAAMTPEEYGVALGVARFEPGEGANAQSLFYLLWDHLELLHRLAVNRVESVGQWQNLVRMDAPLAAEVAADAGVGAELDARTRLLETFCGAWLEGRGQPVRRDVIEASDKISDRFLNSVAEIAEELAGDGVALIEALRNRSDDRLRGFQTKVTDALEGYLLDEGYIDPRPVLSEDDITSSLLAAPVAAHVPARTLAECGHRWWRLSADD